MTERTDDADETDRQTESDNGNGTDTTGRTIHIYIYIYTHIYTRKLGPPKAGHEDQQKTLFLMNL